jgi:intracellular multiplication protein IcmL
MAKGLINLKKNTADKTITANPKQTAIGVQSHVEMAAATELSRNALTRERFELQMKLILVSAAIHIISILAILYLATRPVEERFIATNSAGKITDIEVLSAPIQSDREILQWTTTALTKAYTMSFANYSQQLTDLKPYFTDSGWKSFEQAQTRAGFIENLVGQRFITTAVPSAAPVIVTDGIVSGAHGWRLQVPLAVTFRSAGVDTTQTMTVDVTVVRRPSSENPSGLGIAQLVAN